MEKTKMAKQTAHTAHGDVDYETVVCASCENEVPKQTSTRFIMGDVVEHHNWGYKNVEEYGFDSSSIAKGWACEYCRESEMGVAGFPTKIRQLPLGFVGVAFIATLFAAILIVGMLG